MFTIRIKDGVSAAEVLTKLIDDGYRNPRSAQNAKAQLLLSDMLTQITEQLTELAPEQWEIDLLTPEEPPVAITSKTEEWRNIHGFDGYWISSDAKIFYIEDDVTIAEGIMSKEPVRVELMSAGRRARPSVVLYDHGIAKHMDVAVLFKKAFPELAIGE